MRALLVIAALLYTSGARAQPTCSDQLDDLDRGMVDVLARAKQTHALDAFSHAAGDDDVPADAVMVEIGWDDDRMMLDVNTGERWTEIVPAKLATTVGRGRPMVLRVRENDRVAAVRSALRRMTELGPSYLLVAAPSTWEPAIGWPQVARFWPLDLDHALAGCAVDLPREIVPKLWIEAVHRGLRRCQCQGVDVLGVEGMLIRWVMPRDQALEPRVLRLTYTPRGKRIGRFGDSELFGRVFEAVVAQPADVRAAGVAF